MKILRYLTLLLPLAIAACATSPKPIGGAPDLAVVPGDLPPPTAQDVVDGQRPYLIGPFDQLKIDVFGIDDLSDRTVRVDASGNISFPLVGTIAAGGKTPAEVEQMLTTSLKGAYVRDPQVSVNLEETVSQVVTVSGQVRDPGMFPVMGKMTLMRAIARAKGTSEFAKLNDVVVFRTVDNQKYAALYNLDAIRRGAYSDPEIYANDVVVVGDSDARRLFQDILSIVPLITTPLVVALRN